MPKERFLDGLVYGQPIDSEPRAEMYLVAIVDAPRSGVDLPVALSKCSVENPFHTVFPRSRVPFLARMLFKQQAYAQPRVSIEEFIKILFVVIKVFCPHCLLLCGTWPQN